MSIAAGTIKNGQVILDQPGQLPEGTRVEVLPLPVASETKNGGTVESFLARARRLDLAGHSDAALDLVYDTVDQQMREGAFVEIDTMLAGVAPADLSTNLLLGLLTATLPAKNSLPSRRRLADAAVEVLRNRGEYEQGVLTGLDA